MLSTKQCTRCNKIKEVSEFNNHCLTKDKLQQYCRRCSMDTSREQRVKKTGLVYEIYSRQKRSSSYRNHESPTYTRDELLKWMLSQGKFHDLYEDWVVSGLDKNLKPSVDRINDNIGYTMSNIQLMSWKENWEKGYIGNSKPVFQLDKDGNTLLGYYSLREAERKTGINRLGIGMVCNGKRKTAGGFMWEYK